MENLLPFFLLIRRVFLFHKEVVSLKKLFILFTVFNVLLVGCSQEKKFIIWVDSSEQSQESIDSAIDRLTNAEVDFIIDNNGNVLVNENDMDKAVMCCS